MKVRCGLGDANGDSLETRGSTFWAEPVVSVLLLSQVVVVFAISRDTEDVCYDAEVECKSTQVHDKESRQR